MQLVEQHLIRKSDVRIILRGSCYVVEVVYRKAENQRLLIPSVVAAFDLGVNILAAATSTKANFQPLLINGRPLKSVNHYLHTASRRIFDMLVKEDIGALCIGKNRSRKQDVAMGKKNNQQFVQIPQARFIEMLTYKAQLVGIVVQVQEESYTSKASFLDLDALPTYDPRRTEKPKFSGKREKRGFYRAKNGRRINADVNGSYNILRKAFPVSFLGGQGIEGAAVGAQRGAFLSVVREHDLTQVM